MEQPDRQDHLAGVPKPHPDGGSQLDHQFGCGLRRRELHRHKARRRVGSALALTLVVKSRVVQPVLWRANPAAE